MTVVSEYFINRIVRLEDENAKLREDAERFSRCVADLRQLVSDLWEFTIIGKDTPPIFTAQWHARACAIRDRARDLGVEVDE